MTSTSGTTNPRLIYSAAVLLLIVLAAELALSVRNASQTWDEGCHIYAGYSYWKRADFGMNPEHPPLVKLLATAPLLGQQLKTPSMQDRWFKLEAFIEGRDFVFSNDADSILFRTRLAAATLSLLLAVSVFFAAYEMFGGGTALLALVLLVFEPNLLAHGAWVTTDMGLTCFLFATVYAFYRYTSKPSALRLLVVGLAAGFVLASKHSGVVVIPVLVLLAGVEVLWGNKFRKSAAPAENKAKLAARYAGSLVVVGIIAVGVLWSFYGFRYAARPDGLKMNPPLAEFTNQLQRKTDARIISTAARFHLLPEAYLYGLADVRNVSDTSPSYLFGKVYSRGQWFYFPAAFIIKSTLGLILLLALVPLAFALRAFHHWREFLYLALPPAFHFGQAVYSGLNIGLRHILPIYPYLAILAAAVAWSLVGRQRRWAYVVLPLVVLHGVSSAHAFPHYLAYSNEAWGGSANTYKYLTDSNVDWGQQLKSAKQYLDGRGVKDCWMAYFVSDVVDTSYYGIPCKTLPTISSLWLQGDMDVARSIEGPVLISASVLSGYEFGPGELNPYIQFQSIRPTAVIDHGIFVYDGHFDMPLAAALAHVNRAWKLADENRLDGALAEAQAAAQLAPRSETVQSALRELLQRTKRQEDAEAAK